MTTAAVAAGCAGLAVVLLAPARPVRTGSRRTMSLRSVGFLAVATGVAGATAFVGIEHLVVLAIVAAVVLAAIRAAARARAVRSAEIRSAAVLMACDAMAAELAAGQPPRLALRRAADEWAELAPVARAAELDSDVPTALRELATRPGARELATVAAAWQVAHRSGSSLARTLARTAATLRDERRTTRLVATEIAAARATARMMAALPVLVLLLGSGVGGDPLGFLLGTPVGLGCLAAGLTLGQLGLLWLERIADAVLGR